MNEASLHLHGLLDYSLISALPLIKTYQT